MSVINLNFGQCGNQIGQTFLSKIYDDLNSSHCKGKYQSQSFNKWFNLSKSGKWVPRSILIDTEKKIIENLPFKFRNIVAKSMGGSANNWAYGYMNKSKTIIDEIMDCVRYEAEKCDFVNNFVNILSTSGGTGSGIGTRVIENLHDNYPNKTITNALILPYAEGDIATQSYNSLLALTKLYPWTDNFLIFENDYLHHICQNNLDIKNVQFSHINDILTLQLASVLQPSKYNEFLNDLCSHPQYKFLSVRCSPLAVNENIQIWRYLINTVSRPSRYYFKYRNLSFQFNTLSSVLLCRGLQCPNEKELETIKNSSNFVKWLPKTETFKFYHTPNKLFNIDNCLSLISNSNHIVPPLNIIYKDAWNFFDYGAYLHHYKKFNIDQDFFNECFEQMKQILDNYRNL